MVSILPQEPTFLSQFGQGLGTGLSTGVEDLIKNLGEQRKQAAKTQEQILKERSKLNSSLNSLVKTYEREGLLGDEEKDLLKSQAEDFIQQGYPAELALDTAFKQFRYQEGGQGEQPNQRGIFPALFDHITRGTPEIAAERQHIYEQGASPVRNPLSFLQGATENPLANLMAALGDPTTAAARAIKEGPKSLISPPIKRKKKDETESEKATREFGKELTTAVLTSTGPIGELISSGIGAAAKGARSLLGKLKPRDAKIIESAVKQAAKKSGTTEAQAATKLVKELEGKGLLSNAEVNPKDTRQILKTARAFKEEGTFPVKEVEKNIQEQRRLAKRATVQRDIETEKARRATKKTTPSEEALKETSGKALPRDRKDYFETAKRRREIEDSLKLKESKYSRSDLNKAISDEKAALGELKKSQYESVTGKKYNTKWTNEQAAFKTVQEIENIAKDTSKNIAEELKRIRSRGYQFKNPDLVKQANEAFRKKLPGRAAENQFVKVNEDYANAFLKRMNTIDKEIKAISKKPSLAEFNRLGELQREREMLGELLKDTKKKVALGERREVLKQIDERLNTQKKLLGSEVRGFENLTDEELKTFNLSKEKLNKIEKSVNDFISKSEEALNQGKEVAPSSVANAIRKIDKEIGKNKKALRWLDLSLSSWIQRFIKNSLKVNIPRKTINTALKIAGVPAGYLTTTGLYNKIKKGTRVAKIAAYLEKKDTRALQNYKSKLIKAGISPITVKNYQKAAAKISRK